MAVFVSETDKGVSGIWLYNPDLFDATTIARMAGLYQLVLEKATANPAMRLSELVGSAGGGGAATPRLSAQGVPGSQPAETEERQTQDHHPRIVAGDQGPDEQQHRCRFSSFDPAGTTLVAT